MWVVRKQRFTGRGAGGAHDPVVRPLEPPVAHVSIGLSQGAEVDACQIEPSGGIERPRRIRRAKGLRGFHADEGDQGRAPPNRESGGEGKRGDLRGRRIIKKKKKE